MGSDLHWGEQLVNGNGCQLCVTCESEKEIIDFFTGLSEDGTIIQLLDDMPWGSKFGSLIDKYGNNGSFRTMQTQPDILPDNNDN